MYGADMIPKVQMSMSEFYDIIRGDLAYQQEMTSYIDSKGLQHYISESDYISYLGVVDNLLLHDDITIKLEKIEELCNFSNGTCHVFYAKPNSPSFDIHTDPVDLVLQVTHGSKTLEINGTEITAHSGQCLFVPKETPHRALNNDESIMLSWGLNDST
jgi:hypothetical protein